MLDLSFDPFPGMDTQRLSLRKIVMNDAADIYAIRRDPETMKYISRPLLKSVSEAQNLVGAFQQGIRDKVNIIWGISLKNDARLIGTMGFRAIDKHNLRAEIGYALSPEVCGQGYASEAIKLVIRYGFKEMGLHSIEARVDPRNEPSAKLLIKHGFIKEAHFIEDVFFDGQFRDTEVYSLRLAKKLLL